MSDTHPSLLRSLPSIDALLKDADVQSAADGAPRAVLADAVRAAVGHVRDRLRSGHVTADTDALRDMILEQVRRVLGEVSGPHYRHVINATGIILHTALGRAVLARKALEQIVSEVAGYTLLQADPVTGERTQRDGRIEWLLQRLTGAEAATVVNNNAAATMIVLSTIGAGREVIVSRGHLVEIGGSFRLPDVMAASGARLVEVGTTNKTHPRDYENAVTENTAAILRVHPSNYRVVGFSSEVPLDEMVRIAHAHGLPLIDDVGAGALIDFGQFGFDDQPTLGDSVRAGSDLITASADKLIGGAQGGIILGRAELIAQVRRNPLARVVRVGKLTLAVLEATLSLFLDEAEALREVPTLRMLRRSLEDLDVAAGGMRDALVGAPDAEISVIDGVSQMGSGSLPGENLPTRLLSVRPTRLGATELAQRLRRCDPPVFARIAKQCVLIDPRTLLEGEEPLVVHALQRALSSGN